MKAHNRIILMFAVCLALLLFVSAVGYNVVYTDTNNAGERANLGVRLSAHVLFIDFNKLNKETFINSFLLYKL